MFGIRITTVKGAAERQRRREFLDARIAAGDTQEQAFTAWYNSQAAEETDEDLAADRRNNHLVTKLALFSSLFHQMGFFLAAAATMFGAESTHFTTNVMTWVGPLSVVSGAICIPLALDLASLSMVRKLTMKAASGWSRLWCFLGLVPLAGASSMINYYAPSPHVIFNYGFSGVVILIPIVHGVRALFDPNFGQMLKRKNELIARVAAPAPAAKPTRYKVTAAEKRARVRVKYAQMSKSQQRKFREDWRAKHPQTTGDPVSEMLEQAKEINESTRVPQDA